MADQDNDAIRKITRTGVVTTLFGGPGMADRLRARGSSNVFIHDSNRALSSFTVTAAEAAADKVPDIYKPQCIRVDSNGNLILLELGYGSIRRIVPGTGVTVKLGDVDQIFGEGGADTYRGWAWLDVDRWGNSGPKNGIYWCKSVGETIDATAGLALQRGTRVPPEGGTILFVFGDDWNRIRQVGRRDEANAPHYPMGSPSIARALLRRIGTPEFAPAVPRPTIRSLAVSPGGRGRPLGLGLGAPCTPPGPTAASVSPASLLPPLRLEARNLVFPTPGNADASRRAFSITSTRLHRTGDADRGAWAGLRRANQALPIRIALSRDHAVRNRARCA